MRWGSCHTSTSLILGFQFHNLVGKFFISLYLGHLDLDLINLFFSSACISAIRILSGSFSLPHIFSAHLFKPPFPLYPMFDIVLHTQQPLSPDNLFLLLLVAEPELTLILAPSSLILLINAGKLLLTVISKVILGLIHFKSIQFIFIHIYMCIPDAPINVTANKNRPSPYRFT